MYILPILYHQLSGHPFHIQILIPPSCERVLETNKAAVPGWNQHAPLHTDFMYKMYFLSFQVICESWFLCLSWPSLWYLVFCGTHGVIEHFMFASFDFWSLHNGTLCSSAHGNLPASNKLSFQDEKI